MAIRLGSEAQDKVSGIKGIVVAETRWLYGCLRYSLQPQVKKDGTVPDALSFDEDSLRVLRTPEQTGIHPTSIPSASTAKRASKRKPPGGPRPEPQRQPNVRR
jgi:hypothetical protein